MKRPIGLHIRSDSFANLVQEITQFQIPAVQFFVPPMTNSLKAAQDNHQVMQQLHEVCKYTFVHASYHINLAHTASSAHPLLWEELAFLHYSNITHYVIHPGVVAKGADRAKALKQVARILTIITKRYPKLTLLLENTAHGDRLIGSDIMELAQLRSLCNNNDNIKICIDTAHAYAYGYDIATQQGLAQFITTIEQNIGHENIGLLHLNDVATECASREDHHKLPGDGKIGAALQQSMHVAPWRFVPIIIEAPCLPLLEQHAMLQRVQEWDSI